jgi:hypothetical protein
MKHCGNLFTWDKANFNVSHYEMLQNSVGLRHLLESNIKILCACALDASVSEPVDRVPPVRLTVGRKGN